MSFGPFSTVWDDFADALPMVPDWVVAMLLTVLAVALAFAAHRVAFSIAERMLSLRRPFLHSLVVKLQGPLRLAFVLFALNIAVAMAPIRAALGDGLAGFLQVAFIALIGWMVLTALNIATELYLRRFKIDVADNLHARKQVTQVRILKGAVASLISLITIAAALMTFEQVRQYGVSLFASAGIAGIVVGFAARPVLSNLLAGIQLAITQPIRLDDAVIVEGEWGRVEEITATYVVVRIWDWRRLIVPLTYFIEKPFQNWTRETASLIGAVLLRVDFTVPVARVREKAHEIVRASKHWDGGVFNVQVTDSDAGSMELRVIASAANSGAAFDLRCELREILIGWLQSEYPHALPRRREEWHGALERAPAGLASGRATEAEQISVDDEPRRPAAAGGGKRRNKQPAHAAERR
jgi:small-conductance mechanosensitive channel